MMVTIVQYNVYHKYVLIIRNFTFMMNITNLVDEIDNGVDSWYDHHLLLHATGEDSSIVRPVIHSLHLL